MFVGFPNGFKITLGYRKITLRQGHIGIVFTPVDQSSHCHVCFADAFNLPERAACPRYSLQSSRAHSKGSSS